jgi:hypothetical protein
MSAFSTSHFILTVTDAKIEECICIQFSVKLGKSAIETPEMLCEAIGEHSLSQTLVSEWHSSFKAGQVSVKDDKRSGQPSTSRTIQGIHKRRMRFQKLIKNLFHILHGHNVHCQKWQLSKFLMR